MLRSWPWASRPSWSSQTTVSTVQSGGTANMSVLSRTFPLRSVSGQSSKAKTGKLMDLAGNFLKSTTSRATTTWNSWMRPYLHLNLSTEAWVRASVTAPLILTCQRNAFGPGRKAIALVKTVRKPCTDARTWFQPIRLNMHFLQKSAISRVEIPAPFA